MYYTTYIISVYLSPLSRTMADTNASDLVQDCKRLMTLQVVAFAIATLCTRLGMITVSYYIYKNGFTFCFDDHHVLIFAH